MRTGIGSVCGIWSGMIDADRLRQHLDETDAAIRREIERDMRRYAEMVEELDSGE